MATSAESDTATLTDPVSGTPARKLGLRLDA